MSASKKFTDQPEIEPGTFRLPVGHSTTSDQWIYLHLICDVIRIYLIY